MHRDPEELVMTPVPRRALIVSADIGQGHNSAGRALEEAIACVWPGCQVRWLDALQALDITYVMHACSLEAAVKTEPGMRVPVGALPVRDAFAPADQAAARGRLGLGARRFVAALCTGSLAFGRLDRAVTAVLAAGPDVQAVVICGRNEGLGRELAARGEPPDRLRVLGWTDDMPGWMTASDVVIGNAGGATGLEAMACGRPVVMFDPIAGHGRANAEHMVSAGLAVLALSPAELTATIRRLAKDPAARTRQVVAGLAGAAGRRREDDLAELAAQAGR
jgi:UDP-N-acetylglucosamine:LPS N-acetylglucosamine transferase